MIEFDNLNTVVLGDFGQPATYTPKAGGPFPIGIILAPSVAETRSPGVLAIAFVRAVDVPAPSNGDLVTIDEADYVVIAITADSAGGFELGLNRR